MISSLSSKSDPLHVNKIAILKCIFTCKYFSQKKIPVKMFSIFVTVSSYHKVEIRMNIHFVC